jgi:hypothetical protein
VGDPARIGIALGSSLHNGISGAQAIAHRISHDRYAGGRIPGTSHDWNNAK